MSMKRTCPISSPISFLISAAIQGLIQTTRTSLFTLAVGVERKRGKTSGNRGQRRDESAHETRRNNEHAVRDRARLRKTSGLGQSVAFLTGLVSPVLWCEWYHFSLMSRVRVSKRPLERPAFSIPN